MSYVARVMAVDETRGFMKAIVDIDTDNIFRGSLLGIECGEVMAVLHMSMMGNVPYTIIRDGVFAHPMLTNA